LKSVVTHRLVRVAGPVLAVAVLVAACAKAPVIEPPPPPPLPVSVRVEAAAAADVNPDPEGRASPVIVRIYQLADDAAFGKAELFPLWDQEAQTLAATTVGRHEMRLAPGGRGEFAFKLDPQVRSIGVAAAYRDFRNATWKTSVAIPENPAPGSTIRLEVSVAGSAVTARWQ
jgi:type VI secretion system protein VasD